MHGQQNIKTNWFQSKGSTGSSTENVTYQKRFVFLLLHRAFRRITLIIDQQMHLHKISH